VLPRLILPVFRSGRWESMPLAQRLRHMLSQPSKSKSCKTVYKGTRTRFWALESSWTRRKMSMTSRSSRSRCTCTPLRAQQYRVSWD
jgi:hypothetical protein